MSWDSLSTPVSNSALRFEDAEHLVQVGDDRSDQFVLVGQTVGEVRSLRQDGLDRSALPLQHLHQRLRQGVDLLGVHRLEQRSEAADECVEIQCGARVGDRDERPVRQRRDGALALLELQEAVPDQVLVADRCPRRLRERHGRNRH